MSISLENITAKVQQIGKRNPVYAELSQWVGDLLSTTVKASDKLHPPDLSLAPEHLPETWYQGKSLLNPAELSLDWEQTKDLYKQLVDQVKTRNEGHKQAESLLKALDEDLDGTPALMKSVLASDLKAIETKAQQQNPEHFKSTYLIRKDIGSEPSRLG